MHPQQPWRLFLLVVLASGGAFAILEWRRQAKDSSDQALFLRLPFEDGVQLYMDVQAVRKAGLLEAVAGSSAAEETDYRKFVADTGFNYRQDLDTVCASFSGRKTCFLLRGRFDWQQIRRYAESRGASCVNGYCDMPTARGDRYLSFYSVFPNVLAIGISDNTYGAWAASTQRRPPPGFQFPALPFWIKIPGAVLSEPAGLPAGTRAFASVVKDAERVTLGVRPDSSALALEMEAVFSSPEGAAAGKHRLDQTTGMLRKLIGGDKQKPNPEDLSGILTAGVFEQDGSRLKGSWPVRREFLEAISSGNIPGQGSVAR